VGFDGHAYDDDERRDVMASDRDWLAARFEEHRTHLRAVGYRMLGSLSEADDAVQEAWVRLSRSETSEIENLGGWLTTIVARVCLNILQARKVRREQPLDAHVPDPIVSLDGQESDPEQAALLADSVGLALQVVLETLAPGERLAFVLHDIFGVSFDEIAPIVERSPATARQLASRGRRRVQGAEPLPDGDLATQRAAVGAFIAAARNGDFQALIAVLDPNVVLRADAGAPPAGMSRLVRGAETVAKGALDFSKRDLYVQPALVNGVPGTVSVHEGRPLSVAGFTVRGGRITEINILADPERLRRLDITVLPR
jgi:RNA polymerase sigma factor (sigma-70 family)